MTNKINIPGNIKYALLIFLTVTIGLTGYSQMQSDTALMKTLFIPEVHSEDYTSYLKNSESEIKVVFASLFVIYKDFFSSQDVDACIFSPSCSEYAIKSIDKKGIPGLLDGIDRLLRCHPFAGQKDYPLHPPTRKFYDPD